MNSSALVQLVGSNEVVDRVFFRSACYTMSFPDNLQLTFYHTKWSGVLSRQPPHQKDILKMALPVIISVSLEFVYVYTPPDVKWLECTHNTRKHKITVRPYQLIKIVTTSHQQYHHFLCTSHLEFKSEQLKIIKIRLRHECINCTL